MREVLRARTNRTATIALLLISSVLWLPVLGIAGVMPMACDDGPLHRIPPRSPAALTGSQFARQIEFLSGLDREQAIEAQVLAGNIPQFLRRAVPIFMSGELSDGHSVRITACALVDYLAVGSDRDFLYIPMRLATALNIADRYGFTLPTSRMVDSIYAQASVHLAPQPLPASDQMRSTDYYLHHNQLIAEQRAELGVLPGVLTSGDKKDLVITNRLWRYPERVAIYGWHRGINSPIQPLSTVHGGRYVDYSHGVRLVSNVVSVDGKPMSIFAALADPELARVLTSEGPIPRVTELINKLASLNLDLPSTVSANSALLYYAPADSESDALRMRLQGSSLPP
jgi:hypothetical protein